MAGGAGPQASIRLNDQSCNNIITVSLVMALLGYLRLHWPLLLITSNNTSLTATVVRVRANRRTIAKQRPRLTLIGPDGQ